MNNKTCTCALLLSYIFPSAAEKAMALKVLLLDTTTKERKGKSLIS